MMMIKRLLLGSLMGVSGIAAACGETPLPETHDMDNILNDAGICHDDDVLIYSNGSWIEDTGCQKLCELACNHVCDENTINNEKKYVGCFTHDDLELIYIYYNECKHYPIVKKIALYYKSDDFDVGTCSKLDSGNYNIEELNLEEDESLNSKVDDAYCFKNSKNDKQFEIIKENQNMKIRECPSGCNDDWTACESI